MSRAPASSTHFRQESTSLRCRRQGRASPSRSGGAPPTRNRRQREGFVVRKQPVVARASWLTSSCSSFAWPMVPQVWSPFPALLLLFRRPASTSYSPPPPAYEKSREEDNHAGIHICTSPTPSGAYPTTSRRTYTYSLRHQYSSVYLHTTRATISTKPTPQLRTIMSAYKLRRQKEVEQRRLEARGYSKCQSVPEPVTLKKLQPASEENLQRAQQYLDDFYKHQQHAAPVIDQVHSLPQMGDIAQWVRYVVCTRQGHSVDVIQGETMLQIWHD